MTRAKLDYNALSDEQLEDVKESLKVSLTPLIEEGEDGSEKLKTSIGADVVRASEHLVSVTEKIALIETIQAKRKDEAERLVALSTKYAQLEKENAKLSARVRELEREAKQLKASLVTVDG